MSNSLVVAQPPANSVVAIQTTISPLFSITNHAGRCSGIARLDCPWFDRPSKAHTSAPVGARTDAVEEFGLGFQLFNQRFDGVQSLRADVVLHSLDVTVNDRL